MNKQDGVSRENLKAYSWVYFRLGHAQTLNYTSHSLDG